MKIHVPTAHKYLTWFGILFFCGFIVFLSRNISPAGGGMESLDSDVEGSIMNKLGGITILLLCIFAGLRTKILSHYSFWIRQWPLLLYVGYIFLSALWSVDFSMTIKRSIALFTMVAYTVYMTESHSEGKMFRQIGLVFGVAAALGLVWAVIMPSRAFVEGGIRAGAFIGIFADKNGGARAYVCAILLLLPWILKREKFAVFSAGFCMIAILLSQSASAIVLLVIGFATAMYFRFLSQSYNKQQKIYRLVIGIVVYVVTILAILHGFTLLLELLGRDPTLTDRTIIWELLTPEMEARHTFGYGFGAFWTSSAADDFIERWKYIGNAHNGYVEMRLHGGMVMIYLFWTLVSMMYIRLLRWLVNTTEPWYPAIGIGILTQMLAANYIAFALPNYRSYDFFIFLMLVGYVSNTRYFDRFRFRQRISNQ